MGYKAVEYKVQIQLIFLSFERPLELPKAISFDLHARFSIILHHWKSIQERINMVNECYLFDFINRCQISVYLAKHVVQWSFMTVRKNNHFD